ncbi:MAG: family 20 glycosylhydrolase [Dysgonamonadaceae bacterium]|nr:family 20 glycosylhydrolase [Dysgonamonadaceae bacterium]MDD3356440.1 family 20 glycosylhydrolase [Dysgonamonadaceae bacterium]MDD3728079.1 family 20 glycosylhydrolase [Dysgonamonadaceae bacterium]MDD4246429.1 family 20 glycosylhydrolase [Dysgonamonadaceae bacterium]MDD4605104.1 family 20 glycosylhydrolase [Dysgonamonadaceae bacterium]
MKNLFLILFFILFPAMLFSQKKQSISIIPEPVSIVEKQGVLELTKNVIIKSNHPTEAVSAISFLKEKLATAAQRTFDENKQSESSTIEFMLNKTKQASLGEEGYSLTVSPTKVSITANEPDGLFYGVQTLLQLLPAEIESKEPIENVKWEIPAVEIVDYPRVGWRGLMLDVSRHFFTVDEVKQYIDAMVRYKYNMLHWHLTDDEGWRIEIKSLPKLTEVGAWRVEKIGTFNEFSQPLPDEPKNYGGFYTHDDIREIVQYAKDRFVDVMPEIDVPGHSLAAIAAYPELSCTEGADKYNVRAGEPFMDWSQGAPPIAMIDNTLCPANEKVYEFMDKVITEVAQLFPFEYIHSGGDEAPHNFWEKSPQVKELMAKEGLKTMPEVQSYFGKRIEKIIQSKGKKMMGWDEILEGGITPSTALMSWRGINYGIEASNSGHYVVMSPNNYVYIDLMQGDASTDPVVYQTVRLNQTYKFDPVPDNANAKFVLGGQANLWTEQIYNIRQAEYMTWPRGFAVAESVWSPRDHKNWEKFIDKTEDHFKRLDFAETKYSPAMYDPIVTVAKQDDKYYVTLTTEIDGLDIYTSFDNSSPDRFYPKYTDAQVIPKDASLMRIITYRGKKPIGRLMTIRVEDLKKRAK